MRLLQLQENIAVVKTDQWFMMAQEWHKTRYMYKQHDRSTELITANKSLFKTYKKA